LTPFPLAKGGFSWAFPFGRADVLTVLIFTCCGFAGACGVRFFFPKREIWPVCRLLPPLMHRLWRPFPFFPRGTISHGAICYSAIRALIALPIMEVFCCGWGVFWGFFVGFFFFVGGCVGRGFGGLGGVMWSVGFFIVGFGGFFRSVWVTNCLSFLPCAGFFH